MIRIIGISVILAVLISAVGLLQVEVNELKAEVSKAWLEGENAAAAVRQFEKDVFAKLQNDETARRMREAQLDATRRQNIDDGLSRLPSPGGPAYWGNRPNL